MFWFSLLSKAWRLLLAATLFVYLIFLFTLGHLHGSSCTWEFGTNQRVGNRLELWYDILLFRWNYACLFFNTSSYAMTFYYCLTVTKAFAPLQYIMIEARFHCGRHNSLWRICHDKFDPCIILISWKINTNFWLLLSIGNKSLIKCLKISNLDIYILSK